MNVLFLGAPGSGKGTQSKNIENKFNIPQISTGDLLRAETSSDSEMGQELKKIIMEAIEIILYKIATNFQTTYSKVFSF